MARRQAPAGASSAQRGINAPPPRVNSTEKPPRPIKKEEPQHTRRSARLKDTSRLQESESGEYKQDPISSAACNVLQERTVPQRLQTFGEPCNSHPKRKREQETVRPSSQHKDGPPSKRPRASPQSTTKGQAREAEVDAGKNSADPLESWVLTGAWPNKYFERDSEAGENLFERDSWLEEQMEQTPPPVVQYVEVNGFRYPLPIKKAATLRRKQSDASLTGTSDQKKRESKSTPYRDSRYPTLLAAKGSYMDEFDDELPKNVKDLCWELLHRDQAVPQNSLFRDDLFKRVCREIADRNEAMIIQDITRLLVPSARHLAIYGDKHLDGLMDSVNEAWIGSIPVEGPRPQPDYSVGFKRSAFTDEQLNKLDPVIGTVFDTSFFVASYRMYFPFLTCEVKCGAVGLDIADRQNAHSMTVAVRGVVELYRAVGREKELHQEILAFSISHDHSTVNIYGHYAVIDGSKTTFYRHPIKTFGFRGEEGKEKWTAYRFTKNVYDIWMPFHFKRICSAIDQLPPDLNFRVSQGSELQFGEASGLSQQLGGLFSEQSNVGSASQTSQDDSEPAPTGPHIDTSETSISQGKEGATLKRPKRKHSTR